MGHWYAGKSFVSWELWKFVGSFGWFPGEPSKLIHFSFTLFEEADYYPYIFYIQVQFLKFLIGFGMKG